MRYFKKITVFSDRWNVNVDSKVEIWIDDYIY